MSTTGDIPSLAMLESFRQQADPLADKVVANLLKDNNHAAVSKLFDDLVTNSDLQKVVLPNEVRQYFEQTATLPEWADKKLILKGQRVFAAHGPEMCLVLLCKALPMAYSCGNGAEVMFRTGRMVQREKGAKAKDRLKMFTRRLMETSQFVINVCAPGGLEPDGRGIITAQKVRLIHASIRYFLEKAGWDTETFGRPINQEDLAGTLQSFSTLILEGLGQLGITLSHDEKAAFYHIWHVVGHIVGVDPALNPADYKTGFKLGNTIFEQQLKASEAGVALTDSLEAFLENIIPGNLFDHVPALFIRELCGNKVADLLDVNEHSNAAERMVARMTNVFFSKEDALADRSELVQKTMEHFNLALMQGMLNYYNEFKGVHFYLPPDLKRDWNLDVKWEHALSLSPSLFGFRIGIERKSSTL